MKFKSALLGGVGLCLIAAEFAAAATAPDQAQAVGRADDGIAIGEIVVTAQKRSQRLQDVAGSISAIGSEQLELTGTNNVADLQASTPGLVFGTKDGLAFITVRGVGLSIETGVAEPNVAVHVDGVFLPRATMTTLSGEDLERVEVLRGPQGTLYGRNATGGAINLISKAPSRDWTGGGKFGYANYETVTTSAFVSGPVSDRMRVRLSASYLNRGKGVYDNLFTGKDYNKLREYTLRGAVQSDLTDKLVADASIMFQRTRFDPGQQVMHPLDPIAPVLIPSLATAIVSSEPRTIASDFPSKGTRSTFMLRGGLTWDVADNVQLKSITGYLNHKIANTSDGDMTNAPVLYWHDYKSPSKSFSQEFNLSGKAIDEKLDWLVGAYYFHENYKNIFPLTFPGGFAGVFTGGELNYLTQLREKTTSLAAFSDMTYSLTPHLRIYGGARYSHEIKHEFANLTITPTGSAPIVDCPYSLRQEFNSFSPRVGVQADVADQVMVYGQYQKGFKSGGVNTSACFVKFKPEMLDSYEVGVKSRFLDNMVTLNASAFYYDYKNLQIFRYIATGGQIDNADARVYGAEVEAQIQPNAVFRLDLAATFLNAEYKDFLTFDLANLAGGLQNAKGNRLDRSPKYVFTAAPQLTFPVAFGDFDNLVLRADARFSGEFFFSPFNGPQTRQKAYSTLDLAAALNSPQGMNVRAFVKNLTKTDVISTLNYTPVIFGYIGTYEAPRTYGVEVGFKF